MIKSIKYFLHLVSSLILIFASNQVQNVNAKKFYRNSGFSFGSAYFAINDILPLKAILPSPFVSV